MTMNLTVHLQYTVNLTVINCKKVYGITVDFTVVGGQIGCPCLTVNSLFFTVYLENLLN